MMTNGAKSLTCSGASPRETASPSPVPPKLQPVPLIMKPKHEAFAQAIANGATGVQAYRDCVAKPGTKTKTCMEEASRLLANPKTAARVQELKRLAADDLNSHLRWDRMKAMRYLVEVLETPVGELDEGHRLAGEVTREEVAGGVFKTRIKGISKADALKQLSAMCGWNQPAKVEVSHTPIKDMLKALCGVTD